MEDQPELEQLARSAPHLTAADHESGKNMKRLGFFPALDGLRAVAVAVVIGVHSGLPYFNGGENGVTLFFVLSGFLITKLILEEMDKFGSLNVRLFLLRRFIRLSPPLFTMVAVVTLVRWLGDRQGFGRAGIEAFHAATYSTNLRTAFVGGYTEGTELFLGHTWSLGIEEQFYLLWPFAILLLGRRVLMSPWFSLVLLTYPACSLAARALLVTSGHPDFQQLPLFHFDGFALGLLLAIQLHQGATAVVTRVCGPATATICFAILLVDTVFAGPLHEAAWAPHISVVSVACAIVLGFVLTHDGAIRRALTHPWLTFPGKLSYSLYLWHLPIFAWFSQRRYPDAPRPVLAVAELLMIAAFSYASYRIVERPLESVRARLRPKVAPKGQIAEFERAAGASGLAATDVTGDG